MENINIRKMKEEDRGDVLEMMKVFYASDAVSTNGNDEIYNADIDACVGSSPRLNGYIIEYDGKTAGYSMTAPGFSTEKGGACSWIEDLYLKEEFRGRGLSGIFFQWLFENEDTDIFKLEVEEGNDNAIRSYQYNGFEFLEYRVMVRSGKRV